ncbi:TonB family protein [Spirosoma fluviale]|uniref:TonB family C-terminal domain-containing protein n=1 Tax=Spirosoma fluviale TaxID=1597977 RepID=A0A286F5E0_9BACT|nr:TonB family protein [Spirosoma fluviale]SOD78440.1 TonB family C-terminal domain-containing protein [Spirosoma fluviale]
MPYLPLLLLLTITGLTQAQEITPKLSQDPVFSTVLNRRLKYPRQAEWSSKYGRVFAEFTVDEKGRVKAISILNHSAEWAYAGLEPTVVNALKKLPPLSLQYTGRYILPVSFTLVDYRQQNTALAPTNQLYVQDLAGRVVLNEITVTGSTVNSKERVEAADKNVSY